jgi:hypothetical protein
MIADTNDSALPQDLHTVDGIVVIPYMIRAMQQIVDRLVALETKP